MRKIKRNIAKNNKNQSAGRPAYTPVIPRGKFTFAQLEAAQNEKCSGLTIRNFIKKDALLGTKSLLVVVPDEFRAPDNKKGLGRKQFVYTSRAAAAAVRKAKRNAKVNVAKTDKTTAAIPSALTTAATPAPAPVVTETAVVEAPATNAVPETKTETAPAVVTV